MGLRPVDDQPTYAGANVGHPDSVGVRGEVIGLSFIPSWVGKAGDQLYWEPHT